MLISPVAAWLIYNWPLVLIALTAFAAYWSVVGLMVRWITRRWHGRQAPMSFFFLIGLVETAVTIAWVMLVFEGSLAASSVSWLRPIAQWNSGSAPARALYLLVLSLVCVAPAHLVGSLMLRFCIDVGGGRKLAFWRSALYLAVPVALLSLIGLIPVGAFRF